MRTEYKEEDGYQRQSRLKAITDKWPNDCPEAVAIREDITNTPFTMLNNTQMAAALEALSRRGMLARGHIQSIESFRSYLDESVKVVDGESDDLIVREQKNLLTAITGMFESIFPRPEQA